MRRFWRRTDGYVCLDCGHQWQVPKRVRRRKQKWRGGGYGYADAHAAGVRSISNAYQGYLSDIKDQRNAGRDADLAMASALTTCPNCGSPRHKDSTG